MLLARTVLFSCLLSLSFSIFAAGPELLPPGAQVRAVHLLEFEDEPGHFIFVGKSDHQYNVFEWKNGKVQDHAFKFYVAYNLKISARS